MTFNYDNRHQLHISKSCWLEWWDWDNPMVTINYVEHSPDPWYGDSETDVDITRDEAIEIIKFLRKAHKISEDEA